MKPIILLLLVTLSLAACTNYGKKIKVEGTKGEVYYKGSGVTESDAKKTGEFLKDITYFGNEKGASVQISKEGEDYSLRFVYNKAVYDSLQGAENLFKIIGARISKEVFDGKKVNIALTNDQFKEYKTIPFDKTAANNTEAPVIAKEDFDHDAAGGVNFYWKGISDEMSKKIADYIVSTGTFAGENSEIYMTNENGRYILRFPMNETALTNPSVLATIENVSKDIKDNVFANDPYSFYATDKYFKTLKSWDY